MTSKMEQALAALAAKIETAVGTNKFFRDPETPPTESKDGTVIMRNGDPGEPTVTLSPIHYQWEHQVSLEVAAIGDDRNATVDGLCGSIDTALAGDRTLGNIVIDARVMTGALVDEVGQGEGVQAVRVAQISVRLEYDSNSPLG